VIDLHLHTTASDGRSTPRQLVREAAAAGIRTIAVTDHDTIASVAEVTSRAEAAGLSCVAGIEITAVHEGRDVHILGYFIDPSDAPLGEFLSRQRDDRRRRVTAMADRLNRLGVPIDTRALTTGERRSGRAVGRPMIAAALVAAGHAVDIADAFDRYLSQGRPAFVERIGGAPAEVIRRINGAGGIASLAHPGKTRVDALIPSLADAGLTALEVFHPDHAATDVAHYRTLAASLDLLVTGGSDYHGPGSGRAVALGRVSLPADAFAALAARAQSRRA
jgi:predicted metal-dependent phosphoesterase TrpH